MEINWITEDGGGSLQDMFDSAAAVNAGAGLGEIRYPETVTGDALRSMSGVATEGQGSSFGGVWNSIGGVLDAVAKIELSRYANRRINGDPIASETPAVAAARANAAAASNKRTLLMIGGGLAVLGAVAWLALRK